MNGVLKTLEDIAVSKSDDSDYTTTNMEEVLAAMQGRFIRDVEQGDDELIFKMTNDIWVTFYHCQDCCEDVNIDDVNGDWEDLIGQILIVAEERDSSNEPQQSEFDESYTWTFYAFRSLKGSVDVKWYGTSNGYYSEEVSVKVVRQS